MDKIYLNLTNGIEFINNFSNYKFVRIQSCSLERHCWNKIIRELDYNFLMDLALGYNVVVYDTTNNKNESRAMYQGIPFIKYVLEKRWFGNPNIPKVKGMNVEKLFLEGYNKLDYLNKKKLDYVKKYLNTNKINLNWKCKSTIHDGNYDFYIKLLQDKVKKNE